MSLPFTHDQFLELFGSYNRALWPAVVLLWLLTAGVMVMLYLRGPAASRIVSALLAIHWLWAGTVYHLVFFQRINPAATIFGVAFVVEGILFFWRGVARPRLSFTPRRSLLGWLSLALIVYAMIYPALGLLFGLAVPDFPSFGVPCPTAILTAGALLLLDRHELRLLGVIPIVWSLIAGSAAWRLGIRADLALPVAGLVLLISMVTPDRAKHAAAA